MSENKISFLQSKVGKKQKNSKTKGCLQNQLKFEDTISVFKEGAKFKESDNNLSVFDNASNLSKGKSKSEDVNIDGVIDNSVQGDIGDCWLLAGLNSLNQTKWGRKAIKDSINYDSTSGDSIITLKDKKGSDQKFVITKEELIGAKNKKDSDGNRIYSSGDDDTLVLELATEKLKSQNKESIDSGGAYSEISQLFLGKNNEISYTSEIIKNNFGDLQIKQGLIAGTMTIPMTGNDKDYHSFAIKRFETVNDKNFVVLANPWASGEEIWLEDKDATEEKLGNISFNIIYRPDIDVNHDKNNGQVKISHSNDDYKKDVPTINSDGVIGKIKPAVKRSDGAIVRYLNSLKKTPEGKNIIKQSVNQITGNDTLGNIYKGDVVVNLLGANETYTITKNEMATAKASGMYCSGDDDATALEIALERHEMMHKSLNIKDLKKRLYTENNENHLNSDFSDILFKNSENLISQNKISK